MFIETRDVKSRVFYQYKILVKLSDQISFDSMDYADLSPRKIKNNVLRNIYNFLGQYNDFFEIVISNKRIVIKKEIVLNDDIVCFKLAVQRKISYTAKNTDFTSESLSDFPYSYVFFDVVGQMLNNKMLEEALAMLRKEQTTIFVKSKIKHFINTYHDCCFNDNYNRQMANNYYYEEDM